MRFAMSLLNRITQNIIQSGGSQNSTIFLKHVKWVTGKSQLENHFARFGKIKSVHMFFDPETGLHRGFASITFESPEGASQAIQNKPHIIDGDLVNIQYGQPMINYKHNKMPIQQRGHSQVQQGRQSLPNQSQGSTPPKTSNLVPPNRRT